MKKYYLFLSIICLLMVFGCNREKTQNSSNVADNSIEGKSIDDDSEFINLTQSSNTPGTKQPNSSIECYVDNKYQGDFFCIDIIGDQIFHREWKITKGNVKMYSYEEKNGKLVESGPPFGYTVWTTENDLRGFDDETVHQMTSMGGERINIREDPYGGESLGKFIDPDTIIVGWNAVAYKRK